MAQLPYSISVQRSDPAHFLCIQDWCFTQWPHTHQATWYAGWIEHPLIRAHPYTRTWHFQREEDLQLFTLTWS